MVLWLAHPDLHVILSPVLESSHASQGNSVAPAGGLGIAMNALPMVCATSSDTTTQIKALPLQAVAGGSVGRPAIVYNCLRKLKVDCQRCTRRWLRGRDGCPA